MQDASSKIYANNATLESKISTATTNTSNQITLLQQNVNNQIKDVNSTLSSKKYVETTYKSGNSWYRVWSDGWIEQGGRKTTSTRETYSVSFLKSFTTTNTTVLTQVIYGQLADYNNSTNVQNITKTGFEMLRGFTGSSSDIIWYACGY